MLIGGNTSPSTAPKTSLLFRSGEHRGNYPASTTRTDLESRRSASSSAKLHCVYFSSCWPGRLTVSPIYLKHLLAGSQFKFINFNRLEYKNDPVTDPDYKPRDPIILIFWQVTIFCRYAHYIINPITILTGTSFESKKKKRKGAIKRYRKSVPTPLSKSP